MIDKSFLEKIEDMSVPTLFKIEGREYSSKPLNIIKNPNPVPLVVSTLTSISDYLKKNPDKIIDIIVYISSPISVSVISSLEKTLMGRDLFLKAELTRSRYFPVGQWMPVENFIIAIQTYFIQDEDTASVIKVVGNLTDGKTTNFSDDGVTQQVTAKTGVARVENVPVPSPVLLAPYRTFLEVHQPKSKFIFRIRSQGQMPVCTLFEADGGAWELEAILEIKTWLEKNLPKETVILA